MTERTMVSKAPNTQTISFEGQTQRIGDWIILRLPDSASAKLPSRGQVAVTGVMNGRAFQTVLEPDGKRGHWFKIDPKLRQELALNEDAAVAIEIEVTKVWPEPDVPNDFQLALADTPDAFQIWTNITPMARWEWVRWISATKNPETRQRRVQVGLSKLRSGKRRPCCFDLAACTDPDLSKNGTLVDLM